MAPERFRQPAGAPPVERPLLELLSSMRFAVTMLAVVALASVIGTVLPQGQPPITYVDQFGPFWAQVFEAAGLYRVYGAGWFVLLLGVLIASTSVCIWRTAPRLLADWRAYREDLQLQSLKAFEHRAVGERQGDGPAVAAQVAHALVGGGWRVKSVPRADATGRVAGWMVAAQKGGLRKLGYAATHGAIVLICVGGLIDSDLGMRAAMWVQGVTPYAGGGSVADVPAGHRLSEGTPSFRGSLAVAEGTQSRVALLSEGDGVVLQPLPFSVELKRFIVDYYPSGMPKRFASEVVLHDRRSGAREDAVVAVNHPVNFQGVRIYQSGFEDGGSALQLRGVPLADPGQTFDVRATVGVNQPLPLPGVQENWTLEPTSLRVMNVEPVRREPVGDRPAADVRAVDPRWLGGWGLGAAADLNAEQRFRNVGPSVAYRLRDAAGQAVEFVNYMQPVDVGEGEPVYLYGVRLQPAAALAYLRVPVDVLDDGGDAADFWRLKAALNDADLRRQALDRYAAQASVSGRAEAAQALRASAERVLDLFAGPPATQAPSSGERGLQAVSRFLEQQVPPAQREQATRVLVEVLQGVVYQLLQQVRETLGLPSAAPAPTAARLDAYLRQTVLALNDAMLYPAPVLLTLSGFDQVQASVFQVARRPGQPVVYLGCLLLVVGVFAMLYGRDRRLWAWVAPAAGASPTAMLQLAYASPRHGLEADREFAQLRAALLATGDAPSSSSSPLSSPAVPPPLS
ncbi:MAG: Cytochrome c biogenesis protein CcsB [Paracidovorax wautersii]|uniref:Cytochrome c biogenesis protein CcsB n=1 Tax=Paracidovorax wautersii TaxID=1177982 RepID=A0A7V8JRU9_9BURK|nr:MAG: Cytochrome c biogenesis protein CcsB [Paracidovorax wautersii]